MVVVGFKLFATCKSCQSVSEAKTPLLIIINICCDVVSLTCVHCAEAEATRCRDSVCL